MADKDKITIRQQDADEILRMRRKLDTVRGHGVSTRPDSIVVDANRSNDNPTPAIARDIWLRVETAVASSGIYKHSWTEQTPNGDGWADKVGGRTGTTSDRPVIAGNGFKITPGTVIRAWLIVENIAGTPTPTYRTDPVVPKGVYQGQVYQMLTDETDGWDYPTFHSV